MSLRNPLDVVFVVLAGPLLWFAVRSRLKPWELSCVTMLTVAAIHVSRNSIWLVLFLATPAAAGMRLREVSFSASRRLLVSAAWLVPVVLLVSAFGRTPVQSVAGPALRVKAVQLSRGTPVVADPEDAEQLALDGGRVWIANPIDAFDRPDQRLYLDWLRGRPAGDVLLRHHAVVLVTLDSPAQKRLARMQTFREVDRDKAAVLYRRVS
jgi:hypothetical protein